MKKVVPVDMPDDGLEMEEIENIVTVLRPCKRGVLSPVSALTETKIPSYKCYLNLNKKYTVTVLSLALLLTFFMHGEESDIEKSTVDLLKDLVEGSNISGSPLSNNGSEQTKNVEIDYESWGHWGFWDGAEETRPEGDYCGKYPNRDIPEDEWPENAWQVDAV